MIQPALIAKDCHARTNTIDAYQADAALFLATPDYTLLALDTNEPIIHSNVPLNTRVQTALERMRVAGHSDAAVVGAIPFDITQPAALYIAQPLHFDALGVPRTTQTQCNHYEVRHVPTQERYAAAVDQAVGCILCGTLEKIVLARTLELTSDGPIDIPTIVSHLAIKNHRGYAFSVALGQGRVLLGTSPELLVSCHNGVVTANPLAGSAPRSSDPHEDCENAKALLASAKDLDEHRVVVRAVRESLAPFCSQLDVPTQPVLLQTPRMWHLSTVVRGKTSVDALTLALALHPTPAVCGTPRDIACHAISTYEPFDRGFYAGMLGWLDTNGNGEWIVTLRCAEVYDRTARLYAGAGIVAKSTPSNELAETSEKFRTMLDALTIGTA